MESLWNSWSNFCVIPKVMGSSYEISLLKMLQMHRKATYSRTTIGEPFLCVFMA